MMMAGAMAAKAVAPAVLRKRRRETDAAVFCVMKTSTSIMHLNQYFFIFLV
jgi:hypothetical protein